MQMVLFCFLFPSFSEDQTQGLVHARKTIPQSNTIDFKGKYCDSPGPHLLQRAFGWHERIEEFLSLSKIIHKFPIQGLYQVRLLES
jgi:hypothetical protein